jgi:hypothetical protein
VVTFNSHARSALAEANQLSVGARSGRESLRREMQALEQIRLASAVRADSEHDPRFQRELEPWIRPVVPEFERPDDQPATKASLATPASAFAGFPRTRLKRPVDTIEATYPASRIGMMR